MLPNHPSHLFPTQPSFSSLSAFHSALPGWYRITPCLISVDPREGTGQSGDTGPGKAQGRPAETIVLMPETNASALKRRGPDEPDNEPDVKRPAASKTTASPSNVVGAAAGGFGAVAGGACTWGTGGGASFGGFAGAAATGGGFGGGFAGAATAAGGGFGGVFAGAAAASAGGGGFGAAAVLSAAAPTEKKEPVLATFGQREATTETPVSAEPAPSEDGAPTPAPTLAPSEATQSGEEDEVCIHKVRAKLFRLETRPKVVAESIPNKDDDDDDDDDDDESAPAAAATAVAPAAAPAAAPTTEPEPKPAAGALAGAAAAAEAWGSGVEAGEGGGGDIMETRWLERGVGQVNPHVASAALVAPQLASLAAREARLRIRAAVCTSGSARGVQPLRSQHVAAVSLCQVRSFCVSPRPGQAAHAQRWRRRGLDGAARDARGEREVSCQKGGILGAPGIACHTAACPEARHSQGHRKARPLPMGARTPPLRPGQRWHLAPLNKQVGRLILNAPLLPSTTLVERPTDNTLRLVLYSSESASASCAKPGHFVLRVKIPTEAEALQAAINKCVSNLQK